MSAESHREAGPFTPPSIDELAAQFPNLQVVEMLGRGGMGAVYKAHQTALGRLVALKILPAALGDDPAFADRFVREARALAQLNHPGIVTIHEFGRTDHGRHFSDTRWTRVLAAADKENPGAEEALAALCQTYWPPLYSYARRKWHSPAERGGSHPGFLREPVAADLAPDAAFDKAWALALLRTVAVRLEQDYETAGQGSLFRKLSFSLAGYRSEVRYSSLAAELEMNEPAVRVAVHRLRSRYRALLRMEIAETVAEAGQVDEELRELRIALSK